MKPLANPDWNAALPLQTKIGAQQALLIGHNKLAELIRAGKLETIYTGRLVKITTRSILAYAATGDGRPKRKGGKPLKDPAATAANRRQVVA